MIFENHCSRVHVRQPYLPCPKRTDPRGKCLIGLAHSGTLEPQLNIGTGFKPSWMCAGETPTGPLPMTLTWGFANQLVRVGSEKKNIDLPNTGGLTLEHGFIITHPPPPPTPPIPIHRYLIFNY
jgi:hypothetical protein